MQHVELAIIPNHPRIGHRPVKLPLSRSGWRAPGPGVGAEGDADRDTGADRGHMAAIPMQP
jgi:hypothetical protein